MNESEQKELVGKVRGLKWEERVTFARSVLEPRKDDCHGFEPELDDQVAHSGNGWREVSFEWKWSPVGE